MSWKLRSIAVATLVAIPRIAAAEGPDVAGAEALFEQGRKLMAQGKVDEACPKFAESERLAPAAGTALNLATCYEKQGRTASAWGMYHEAISLSITSGQALREQYARDRVAELEPRLMRVIVRVASDEPGLEVLRDGTTMTRAQWGTPIPVDPGTHRFEAIAPHKKKWSRMLEAKGEGSVVSFTVPPLEDAPVERRVAQGETPPPAELPPSGGGALRVIGFASIAVGAGLVGTGGFFALSSSSKKDEIEQAATAGEPWSADRQATYDDGESAATLANVFFVTGGVVLATGAVLTVLGYAKKSSTGSAPRPTGPSFAGAGVGPRGGSVAWTF